MFILSIKQNKTYLDNTVILHVPRFRPRIWITNIEKNKAELDISFVFFLFIFSSIEKMLKYDAWRDEDTNEDA